MCVGCCECLSDICLIIISVLFPPLPVWIRRGVCSCDSLINILLCFLGYFPGLIHSWYIIAKYPPYTVDQQSKVYYIYRSDLEAQAQHHHHHHHHHDGTSSSRPTSPQPLIQHQPAAAQNPSYGAIDQATQPQPPPYSVTDKTT